MDETKDCYTAAKNTPHQQMREQMRFLDMSLSSVNEFTDDGREARRYLVGQIDALKWAMRLLEV